MARGIDVRIRRPVDGRLVIVVSACQNCGSSCFCLWSYAIYEAALRRELAILVEGQIRRGGGKGCGVDVNRSCRDAVGSRSMNKIRQSKSRVLLQE